MDHYRQKVMHVKGDVIFQANHWLAQDFEYDDDVEDPSKEDCTKYLIKVFGVTEDGKTVSVNVLNFTPFFFLKIHHATDRYTAHKLQEYVVSRLSRTLKTSLLDVVIVKKKDFWGFQNHEKCSFARLKFKNLRAYKQTIRMFMSKVEIPTISKMPIKYKLYESNIEPFLRMIHIRDIEPCGWLKIPEGSYESTTMIMPSHCQIEVDCDWKCLYKHALEKLAPLMTASFDIECTSSHGDFPVARKTYKKTAYEFIQYFEKHKHDVGIRDTLFEELMKIFKPEDSGVLSKVYTKQTPCIQDLERRLKKTMDDIFAILSGKLQYKETAAQKDAVMQQITSKLGDFKNPNEDDVWIWEGIFPPLEGDPVIQIGTTVHLYGEKSCCYRSIITVGTCDSIDGVDVTCCEDERDLLLKWRDLIVRLDPDVITGYNIFGFDMSYLFDRSKELGIDTEFCKIGRLIGHKSEFVQKFLSSSALGDNILKYIDMEGRVLIDVMKVVQRDHKLDSYKLDAVANHFMKMNKHDVHPSDIFRLQKGSSADRKVIADYCVQDCALCNHLIMKLEILANNIGMSNVCNVPLSYIFMRGQGIKIFSLVAKECREYDFLIPTLSVNIKDDDDESEDEDGYEGAIVLEPHEGIYIDDPVSVLDYASLYPSSMISENLSHDCIVLNEKYDNLPGYEYLDIAYDVYEKVNDKKIKVGEKKVRFVQFPDGEKGTIPKILMKLLRQRKETRKKIEFKTVETKTAESFRGVVKEHEDVVSITGLDGKRVDIARENVVSIEDTYDDFQKAVLDGLQLAYKVTANSLYGQCGAKTSQIYMKDIAACTTATGRKMILLARDYILANYEGAEIVYGDSVPGYTPVMLRIVGKIVLDTFDNIAIKYGKNKWLPCTEEGKITKEGCELQGVEVWTDEGWTNVERIIRHNLAPHKKIMRVLTHMGCIDVTDDHSLFTANGNKISPKDLEVGMQILHSRMPHSNLDQQNVFSEDEARIMGFFMGDGSCSCGDCNWELISQSQTADTMLLKYKALCEKVYPQLSWRISQIESSEKLALRLCDTLYDEKIRDFQKYYKQLFYDDHGENKLVPNVIINAPINVQKAFWEGLCDADGFKTQNGRMCFKSMLSCAGIFVLARNIGIEAIIDDCCEDDNLFTVGVVNNNLHEDASKIKKMYEIPYEGYVYDFTTKNHKFQAGIGDIIASNTDSLFVKFNPVDENGNKIIGKAAIPYCRNLGIQVSKEIKPLLKKPHDLEWEKLFWPFILFSKKRYCANKYEFDDDHCKMNSMGIVLKRRDNAHIVKKIYGGVLDIILNEQDISKSVAFLKDSLNHLSDGKYPLEDLVISKSLRADYKDPTRIAHKVLAERMGERDPGTKPQVNDRIPFVYVQVDEKKGQKMLQGDRIEHPDYIRANKLKPDYEFYITNQIMKPILQLYALTLEKLEGYRKGSVYFEDVKKRLVKEKEGDMKKVKERVNDLREDEVKKLLFDPVLVKLQNRKNRNMVITDFFKSK
jgi:DNA polymerase elongation subunit (family B)